MECVVAFNNFCLAPATALGISATSHLKLLGVVDMRDTDALCRILMENIVFKHSKKTHCHAFITAVPEIAADIAGPPVGRRGGTLVE